MLKDMFPQNAIDMGMMKETGLSGLLYRHFRKQEQNLYKVSDFIGCTSPEHIKYLLKHNSFIKPEQVEICPNSLELFEKRSYDQIKMIVNKFWQNIKYRRINLLSSTVETLVYHRTFHF